MSVGVSCLLSPLPAASGRAQPRRALRDSRSSAGASCAILRPDPSPTLDVRGHGTGLVLGWQTRARSRAQPQPPVRAMPLGARCCRRSAPCRASPQPWPCHRCGALRLGSLGGWLGFVLFFLFVLFFYHNHSVTFKTRYFCNEGQGALTQPPPRPDCIYAAYRRCNYAIIQYHISCEAAASPQHNDNLQCLQD